MKQGEELSAINLSAEDDENYFVSLSDLMTGVLFVFVILTTALALHYQSKAKELEETQQEGAKAQAEAGKARSDARQVQEALDALAKILREREQLRKEELQGLVNRMAQHKIDVELDETNGILRLPGSLLFDASKAELQPTGEIALSQLAREMLPVVVKGCSSSPLKWEAIYIEGHTDNVPIYGTFPSNWHLSSARAINTYKALLVAEPSLALQLNHQNKSVIGISGYGEHRPVADNSTEAGKQKNRRIDIRFVMAYPSQAEIQEMERKLKEATQKIEAPHR